MEDIEHIQHNNQIRAAATEVGDSGHWFPTATMDDGI